tara:strand:- start:682 stop:1227 length:546 start_codon:yes stop_codon:yes gene_type:complete
MKELTEILRSATKNVGEKYFQIPISGSEDLLYRERVYCYELYHQMRSVWPIISKFTLGGEIDKSSHPLIRGSFLDRRKPDFLVHMPGDMGNNYAVIEVKPINAQDDGINKDLKTLTAFYRHAGYERAIYLIYGRGNIDKIVSGLNEIACEDDGKNSDISLIELWWHEMVGHSAKQVRLNRA